ncbi:acyl carrier protein [Ochromonadaceae sp. CCMP2298]|nr:acyl carrier protein [Ochromonadaceae sp. CCMP2298]|eukprot:CAMPEP_0173213076 /NCGR_PEP_ID=MMETSP1141-20130122/25169_1 /TAXON_ID=483371 /ORGANISM="non described non described, Strain CCMP2298" /LENGTH=130 /DNA_ID=CAMNT_0014140195 /DNA_START=76 /DNA_END=468 /DNA_ORIENTATION=-
MFRILNIAKIVARPASRFATSRVAQPVTFCVKAYSTSMPAFSAKDEPFLDVKVVLDRVIDVLKNFEKVTEAKVTPLAKFKEDLELDSLDAVEVVMALEEEFCIEIPDSEADKILSIPDAVAYISGHPMAK